MMEHLRRRSSQNEISQFRSIERSVRQHVVFEPKKQHHEVFKEF